MPSVCSNEHNQIFFCYLGQKWVTSVHIYIYIVIFIELFKSGAIGTPNDNSVHKTMLVMI